MLNRQERQIYFTEIRQRGSNAVRAWDEAETALRNGTNEDFWFAVDSFLASSVAVANLLWPSSRSTSARARAQELRGILGVGANAPSGLRDTRNGFEHFDERIDTWRQKTQHHVFVDTLIGPPGTVSGASIDDIARSYDTQAERLSVFGVVLSVPAVLSELQSVLASLPQRP